MLLNRKLEIFGIYDSGSNISLINSKLLKLKDSKSNSKNNANLITINGVKKTSGLTTIKIKIFEIEKEVDVYIIDKDNFKYDFLIGLDMIQNFKLIQNENLKITQKNNLNSTHENNLEEIFINKITNLNESVMENIIHNEERYTINFNEHMDTNNFQIKIEHLP